MASRSPQESPTQQKLSPKTSRPSSGTRPNFFKRLSHHRHSKISLTDSRSSKISLADSRSSTASLGDSPPSQRASRPASTLQPIPVIQRSVDGSVKGSTEGANRPSLRPSASTQSGDELTRVSSKGVKWANDLDGAEQQVTGQPSRSRSRRRSSIYSGHSQVGFIHGVDAGVGSKARRLSVDVPLELLVDECPLEDHFNVFTRIGKRKIGEGGAAAVQLMQSKDVGTDRKRLVAVKEFRPWCEEDETEAEYERKIKSEYAIARSCNHPSIVETFCLCTANNQWYHVMEYCDQGDLCDLIKRQYFGQDDCDCLFKQLLRGVDYLHRHGIAHRDLKSENLLLTKNGGLKIADFGTAEVFSGRHPGLRAKIGQSADDDDEVRLCKPGMVGSTPYMAPEVLKRQADYDPRAVDVWSCAIVYLSLCFCGLPWDAASTDVKNFNIYLSTWDAWLQAHPDGTLSPSTGLPKYAMAQPFRNLQSLQTKFLILGMLNPDPSKRTTAKEAIDSVVLKNWSCCQANGQDCDWRTRERLALHNHLPRKESKVPKWLQPSFDAKGG